MADKIEKYLSKLSIKDLLKIREVVAKVLNGDVQSVDIKKLKGTQSSYRVRVGDHRVFFIKINNEYVLEDVKKRDENTY